MAWDAAVRGSDTFEREQVDNIYKSLPQQRYQTP